MCGIVGILGRARPSVAALVRLLGHRGPDASGTFEIPEVGVTLGHTRLGIIDLDPRSHQPFVSTCGRYALVFNGEIYNYLELRERLEAEGQHFRTSSDTEVLLDWLIRRGPDGLADLDGMFAFCLVDREARTLFLARDPIGEKPLYYALGSGAESCEFAFASELKALLALEGVDRSLDDEAVADYLRFLYTAAPRTLYRGIRELPPGHWLRIDARTPREQPVRYYDLELRSSQPFDGDHREAVDVFRRVFLDELRLRLRSDVSIGIYLSGGLDSNSILGAARSLEPQIDLAAYTIRYGGSEEARSFDESYLASRSASFYGVPHTSIEFAEGRSLVETAEDMVRIFDQPFGNATAVVSEQVAREASRRSKVCLVGDGGDELLAGYPRHKALLLRGWARRTPSPLRRVLAAAGSGLRERGRLATSMRRLREFADGIDKPVAECFLDWSTYADASDLQMALGRTFPTTFHASMLDLFDRNQSDPLRAAALVDLHSFVPYNLLQAADRTSMAHGLELRCPFLATRLVEFSLSIPWRRKVAARRNKPILADAFRDVSSPFVERRRKRPFNPPMGAFVRHHLDELEDHLLGPGARCGTVLARPFLRREIDRFRRGRSDNSTHLWGLATLESWLRRSGASIAVRAA